MRDVYRIRRELVQVVFDIRVSPLGNRRRNGAPVFLHLGRRTGVRYVYFLALVHVLVVIYGLRRECVVGEKVLDYRP